MKSVQQQKNRPEYEYQIKQGPKWVLSFFV